MRARSSATIFALLLVLVAVIKANASVTLHAQIVDELLNPTCGPLVVSLPGGSRVVSALTAKQRALVHQPARTARVETRMELACDSERPVRHERPPRFHRKQPLARHPAKNSSGAH